MNALRSDHPELGEVVDVCVSAQAARHSVRSTRVHLMTGSYPIGSFRRIGEGAIVAAPELAFLQAVSNLDADLLVAYGYEICGFYAREGEGSGSFVNCPALTSTAKIAAYLSRLEEAAKAVGRGLGIRWREPSPTIRTRQMNLRRKLLMDIGM